MKSKKWFNILMIVTFVIFIFILVLGIMLKTIMPNGLISNYEFLSTMTLKERFLRGVKLLEFYQIEYKIGVIKKTIILDALNLVVFIPFGFLVTHFFKKARILFAVLVTLACTLLIELFQLTVIIGAFMLNDLVLNVIGGLIGSILFVVVTIKKNYQVFNILLIIFSSICLIVLLYLIINLFLNIDIYIDIFNYFIKDNFQSELSFYYYIRIIKG